MKNFIGALVLATLSASASIAGSYTPPAGDMEITPPPATGDWSGYYLGGMYGLHSATIVNSGMINNAWNGNGNMYGAFAGYTMQKNALVYGGELAYSTGQIAVTGGIHTSLETDSMIDAKARLGYAMDDTLVYAVLGGTFATFNTGSTTANLNMFNYGVGAEMKFDNGLFFGAEYLMRSFGGDNPGIPATTLDMTTRTIQIRVGKRF